MPSSAVAMSLAGPPELASFRSALGPSSFSVRLFRSRLQYSDIRLRGIGVQHPLIASSKISIQAVVIPQLKFRDVERKIFAACGGCPTTPRFTSGQKPSIVFVWIAPTTYLRRL